MRFALIAVLLVAGSAFAQDEPIRTVALNGIEMAYQDYGTGEPLVLLHGFGGCAEEAWGPFMDTLSVHYRLIIPEQRGHGHSTNPAGTFTHRQASSDLLTLLDTLGLGPVKAIGVSSGGMTLLHAATRAPERFERLVIVGVGTAFPEETAAWVRTTTLETLPPDIAEAWRACAARGEPQAIALVAQFAHFADATEADPLAPADLSGVSVPTLLVEGDRDLFFPVEQIVSLYHSLPDAKLWVVPGGDHVPIYDPLVPFAATALRFLADGPR